MPKGKGQSSGMARLQNIKITGPPKGKKVGKAGKWEKKGGKKGCK